MGLADSVITQHAPRRRVVCVSAPASCGAHAPWRGLAAGLRARQAPPLQVYLLGHADACSGAGAPGTTVPCACIEPLWGPACGKRTASSSLGPYNPQTITCQFQTQGRVYAGVSTWTLHKVKRTRAAKATNSIWRSFLHSLGCTHRRSASAAHTCLRVGMPARCIRATEALLEFAITIGSRRALKTARSGGLWHSSHGTGR